MKKILILLLTVVVIGGTGYFVINNQNVNKIENIEEINEQTVSSNPDITYIDYHTTSWKPYKLAIVKESVSENEDYYINTILKEINDNNASLLLVSDDEYDKTIKDIEENIFIVNDDKDNIPEQTPDYEKRFLEISNNLDENLDPNKTKIINGHEYNVTFIDSEFFCLRPLVVTNDIFLDAPVMMGQILQIVEDDPTNTIYKFVSQSTGKEVQKSSIGAREPYYGYSCKEQIDGTVICSIYVG